MLPNSFPRFLISLARPCTVRKEMNCGGDSEILQEIAGGNTQKS